MKTKAKVKIIVDILMTALLMFAMGYQFWGDKAHEYFGIAMFVLFIFHHILNLSWHKNLFKGRYNRQRIITLTVDILVLLSMLCQMISGIVISKYAFAFLNISNGITIARKAHIVSAYLGFILMSIHIGLHLNMIVAMIKRNKPNKLMSKISTVLSSLFSIYGIYAFFNRDFLGNIFLKNEFVFLNYDEPKIFFYIDFIAVMWLFIFLTYSASKLIKEKKK